MQWMNERIPIKFDRRDIRNAPESSPPPKISVVGPTIPRKQRSANQGRRHPLIVGQDSRGNACKPASLGFGTIEVIGMVSMIQRGILDVF